MRGDGYVLSNPHFEASYERLFGDDVRMAASSDAFFHAFYERFLTHADVAALFNSTDMQAQVQMLKRSLFYLVSLYVTGTPSPELERLAERHRDLGVPGEMFDKWLAALLDTVLQLDPQADEVTRLAWAWALTPGITYMRLALLDDA